MSSSAGSSGWITVVDNVPPMHDGEKGKKALPPGFSGGAEFLVEGLVPVSTYSFRVRAESDFGWSIWSEASDTFSTLREY